MDDPRVARADEAGRLFAGTRDEASSSTGRCNDVTQVSRRLAVTIVTSRWTAAMVRKANVLPDTNWQSLADDLAAINAPPAPRDDALEAAAQIRPQIKVLRHRVDVSHGDPG